MTPNKQCDFRANFYLVQLNFFYQAKTHLVSMTRKEEEVILMEELKKGSHQAMDKIYRHWGKDMYKAAYFIVGNQQDAEDIVQEVLIKVWDERDKLNIMDLPSYLSKAATNRALNHVKKKNNELSKHQKASEFQETVQLPSEYQEAAESEKAADAERVMNAFQKLSKQQAIILNKVVIEGQRHKAVAQSIQLKITTVRKHLWLGLSKMRELLKKIS
ncbi:RNA polymerase sigma factor (sigma-70 family) [Chitinophaga sp. S165]|nr:RNA polymerase sigma factor (sigma-70 family) [Chitinophaga sp. S165]